MAKSFFTLGIISLLLIAILFSGCISPRSTSTNADNNQYTVKPTRISTGQVINPTTIPTIHNPITGSNTTYVEPVFAIGQIASSSPTSSSGLGIVDYNSVINMYGTLEVKKNNAGNGWYTDGYPLIIWKPVSDVNNKYKTTINVKINPTDLPEFDVTKQTTIILSTPCDLVGDWEVQKGKENYIYKFRLDNKVVRQSENQTYVGDWITVRSKDGRDFVIRWGYGPSNVSANYIEKITLSSNYGSFTLKDNYGQSGNGKWIGLIPSWKEEYDKANSDKEKIASMGSDCYKWLGGGEWYN